MNKKTVLLKYFFAIFIIGFFAVNWSEVSWVFNYDFMSGAISDIFKSENQALASSDNHTVKSNSIEIPGLDVYVPVILGRSMDNNELEKDLDRGAVMYPDSVLPGENGQTVILGHSSNPDWPKVKYDWIFSEINLLNKGDRITVNFNNRKYAYNVKSIIIVEKGEDLPKPLTDSTNMLILVSCWPPGKDFQRIVVQAELVK